jgi:hypothetical protein
MEARALWTGVYSENYKYDDSAQFYKIQVVKTVENYKLQ